MDGFVEVTVDATGATQMVPEHFIGDPIVGRGLTPVEADNIDPVPAAAPLPPPDVETVFGEESTLPLSPAARDAVQAASAVVDAAVDADPPTERSTHEEIDAYAATHGIELGEGANGTKAEKLALIDGHTTHTDDNPSPDENPPSGDKEN